MRTERHHGHAEVVDQLRPFGWDSEAAFAYEAAVEALNGKVGACTAALAAAWDHPWPGIGAGGPTSRLRTLTEQRRDCHRTRAALQPDDAEAVAAVRSGASAEAAGIRAETARLLAESTDPDPGPASSLGGTALNGTVLNGAASLGQLTEAQNAKIFQEEIVPDVLEGSERRPAPIAVVLLGQQGASKTRMAKEIARRLNERGGFADIDSDFYKPYHPAYDGLLVSDDRVMAMRTGRDGQRWMRLAQSHARDQRRNILVHETAQSPAYFEQVLRGFRREGYRVEVLVLGVPEAMSRQGIVKRYREQVRDRGHGRLTVNTKATRSYQGILEAADLIDEGHLADAVAVVRRGGVLCYRNALAGHTEWAEQPGLRAAIAAERTRSWTTSETADFHRVHAGLTAELDPKWLPELDQIATLATPLMST